MEDLNYLFHRQSIELFAAGHAASPSVGFAHRTLAAGYGARIEAYRASHHVAPLAAVPLDMAA